MGCLRRVTLAATWQVGLLCKKDSEQGSNCRFEVLSNDYVVNGALPPKEARNDHHIDHKDLWRSEL